jgi:hypothetical protein
MHMEMNLSPMTREIEKLRTYITTLVDSMANNKKGESIQMTQIKEIKDVLNSENSELRQKMRY